MQGERRRNPYPLTWEIPLAVLVAAVLLAVLGVHAGRAVANLVAGAGLTLPRERSCSPAWSLSCGGMPGRG